MLINVYIILYCNDFANKLCKLGQIVKNMKFGLVNFSRYTVLVYNRQSTYSAHGTSHWSSTVEVVHVHGTKQRHTAYLA